MIYLRNNKVNTCYLGDKKLNKIYLGDKLVWPQKKSFDANGHDFVEIAGIKWATMNVGANSITDYGYYFQWGDTQGYTADKVTGKTKEKAFDWSDYKWYDKENSTSDTPLFTKYNGTDGYTELALEDDAVHAAWGGSWRMPTSGEMQTLVDAVKEGKVSSAFTTNKGVNGLLLTDNADSSKTLFLPACGFADDGSVYDVGSCGSYWLSSLFADDVSNAYGLDFGSDDADVNGDYGRCSGRCVRGVLAEN